jgi:hypothetical protein
VKNSELLLRECDFLAIGLDLVNGGSLVFFTDELDCLSNIQHHSDFGIRSLASLRLSA